MNVLFLLMKLNTINHFKQAKMSNTEANRIYFESKTALHIHELSPQSAKDNIMKDTYNFVLLK